MISCTLILLAVSAGCQETARTEPIVIRVDDRTVTRREFDRMLLPRLAAQGNPPAGSSGYEMEIRQLIREQIDEQLLLAEARRRGITLEPGEIDGEVTRLLSHYEEQELERELSRRYFTLDQWREMVARRLLLERVSDTIAASAPDPDDAELRQQYDEMPDRFGYPERFSVSQILLRSETEALEIINLIRKRNVPFEKLARERSVAPEAARDGFVGEFAAGELPPELETPVRHLSVGEISGVVRTSYGYHVFRLNSVIPPGRRAFEDVRDELAGQMRSERRMRAVASWLEKQRKAARIEVTDDLLKNITAAR